MIIHSTKVRFDKAPTVFIIMVKMSFKDFHDLASLNTLRRRNDLSIERPLTPSANSSTNESATIKKSKQFHPSCNNNNY